MRWLYRIALSREPDRLEQEQLLAFLQQQQEYHSARAAGAETSLAALTDLAHVLLNANEFVYIN